MPAQVGAAHPARVVDVRERPLDVLAASPHQPCPARAAHAPTIAVHRRLRLRRLRPVPATAIGLRDVGPHRRRVGGRSWSGCCDSPCRRRSRPARPGSSSRLRGLDLFGRGDAVVATRLVVSPTSAPCRVTATSAPLSRSTACSALCARCVRPSFIFVIFASGSDGFCPVLVRRPLLPPPIQARQGLAGRRLDARGRREPRQELLVALPGVPPHDAAHRRVGLQRRRVDRDGPPREQPGGRPGAPAPT